MRDILVLGGSGMLGKDLVRTISKHHRITATYNAGDIESIPGVDWVKLDVTSIEAIKSLIIGSDPDILIHCVGMIDIDACESEPFLGRLINTTSVLIALKYISPETKFIFISSDYVFNGTKGGYLESDIPNPINVYGETKYEAEQIIQSTCRNHLILRLALLGFSSSIAPKSVFDRILAALHHSNTVSLPADQYFSPVSTCFAADIVNESINYNVNGILHVGSDDRISKFDCGRRILDTLNHFEERIIESSSILESVKLAPRPRDTSLSNEKLKETFNIKSICVQQMINDLILLKNARRDI
ncbi:SDR family oxidoreductase [Gemmatimonadota bacterium]